MDVFSVFLFFFSKQKTAYEMRISDWSSDVCSSDLKCSQFSVPKTIPQPYDNPVVLRESQSAMTTAAKPSDPAAPAAPRSELNQRQEQIIALVRERGFVAIEALADHFDVTPQTIRRDINELCDLGLLRRYHGGAGLPSSVENRSEEHTSELQS